MKYEIYILESEKTQSFYKKAIAEYEKRLGRYCRLSCKWIKKEKQWERLVCEGIHTEDNEPVFFVREGSHCQLTSEELSERIGSWESSGKKKVTFLIDARQSREKEKNEISLSDFSLPPAMTGMVLAEQIYRGYRILHCHPYHK